MPAQRKLQNADFKTEADLGAASRLLNDTKIYISGLSINKTLDQAIVDGDIGGAPTFELESFTLTNTNISNGYVDLGFEAALNAVFVRHNRMSLEPAIDFTTSIVSLVTRVDWSAGDFGIGGNAEFQEGDIIHIQYARA